MGDKVSEADKSTVTAAISELKTQLEGEDTDAIEAKTNALAQAAMKLGEAMYQNQQAEAGDDAGDGATSGQAEDDVVDADFEEVQDDDDKKAS
jgi:molecular chaperone DnaK